MDLGREGYSLPGAGEERPHRAEGERALLKIERPSSACVALDFSPTMLEAARHRFEGDRSMRVVEHDLREPLPDLEPFEAIVSCFAIHRCKDERKRALYAEIYTLSKQGGTFYNLEIVSSPTQRLRERFLIALGYGPDWQDHSGHLLDVETQLGWLRKINFTDMGYHWKWLGMALLGGAKPESSANTW